MSVANIGSLLFIGYIKWLKYVIFSKPSVHILPRHIIGFHGNNGNITETNHTKNWLHFYFKCNRFIFIVSNYQLVLSTDFICSSVIPIFLRLATISDSLSILPSARPLASPFAKPSAKPSRLAQPKADASS